MGYNVAGRMSILDHHMGHPSTNLARMSAPPDGSAHEGQCDQCVHASNSERLRSIPRAAIKITWATAVALTSIPAGLEWTAVPDVHTTASNPARLEWTAVLDMLANSQK